MHAAVLTAFLFALTGVCATQSSRLLGASRANAYRLVVALALLGFWAHSFGNGFSGGVVGWFVLAGGIGFGMGGWCMFQALRRIGSTLSLLAVECWATLFATTIGWMVLGAALSGRQLLFMALLLAGVVIGVAPKRMPNLDRRILWTGFGFAVAAALFQAISFNLSRHGFTLLQEDGVSLDRLTAAYQRLAGGVIVAGFLFLLTHRSSTRLTSPAGEPWSSPLPAPAWVFLNATFGPVLGVTCMLWAISLVANPGLVQSVAATATLMTVPFSWFLEGSRPRITYYVGCVLALGGTTGLLLATITPN